MKFLNIKDNYGNLIYSKDWKIFLYLKEKQQTRKLGQVFEWDLYCERKNKHILKKYNAYGFNYELLKVLNPENYIFVKTELGIVMKIQIKQALNDGKFLFYLKDGFEKQLFVPLEKFKFR